MVLCAIVEIDSIFFVGFTCLYRTMLRFVCTRKLCTLPIGGSYSFPTDFISTFHRAMKAILTFVLPPPRSTSLWTSLSIDVYCCLVAFIVVVVFVPINIPSSSWSYYCCCFHYSSASVLYFFQNVSSYRRYIYIYIKFTRFGCEQQKKGITCWNNILSKIFFASL